MQNLWQKKLKLNYSKDVVDIVQFGSSISSDTPNDVDIAIIFWKIPVKEQLIQSQNIKKQLEKVSDIPIHVTSFDISSFFNESNFAKENILISGKSLISGDFFAKSFGFTPRLQISYSLTKLKKKDKVRFNYMLNGKKGNYGLLRKYGGVLLHPGLIEISPDFETIFLKAIKEITDKFKIKKILTAD
ncbi:MAG: hypothetical protein WC533_04380 [Candidatus Pacearchaeota archaeon]